MADFDEREYGFRIHAYEFSRQTIMALSVTKEQLEPFARWLGSFLSAKDHGIAKPPEPPEPVTFELGEYGFECCYLWSHAAWDAIEALNAERKRLRDRPLRIGKRAS